MLVYEYMPNGTLRDHLSGIFKLLLSNFLHKFSCFFKYPILEFHVLHQFHIPKEMYLVMYQQW